MHCKRFARCHFRENTRKQPVAHHNALNADGTQIKLIHYNLPHIPSKPEQFPAQQKSNASLRCFFIANPTYQPNKLSIDHGSFALLKSKPFGAVTFTGDGVFL